MAVTANALRAVCEDWIEHKRGGWAETYASKVTLRLGNDVYPVLGAREIDAITTPDIRECLRHVEERGAIDSARRIKHTLGQVYRFAIVNGRATSDPTTALRGALPKIEKKS